MFSKLIINKAKAHIPVTDVLIKPTGADCNLDCAYCFYNRNSTYSSSNTNRMNEQVLETMIAQLCTQTVPALSFGWQGGEPTLMGIDFYKKAIGYMQRYGSGKMIANGLQTNGILIDQAWAQLFKQYQFLIGLSLDGPQNIHDHYRMQKNDKSSFEKVIAAAKRLLDAGVEVNVLTVINDYSVQFPDEIYTFHKSLGLHFMQFIPCLETDPDGKGLANYSLSAVGYREFLCKLFDLWLGDFSNGTPTTSIRFFESLLFQYAGFAPTECTQAKTCGTYLVIEHNGDVYPCDFYVDSDWKLGNLLERPLVDLMNSDKQSEFGKLKSKVPGECYTCEWMKLCRGGCTKDRFRNPIHKNHNHFCAAYKEFFNYANQRLKKLSYDWKQKQFSH
jgi:uncharacterized protein